MNTFGNEVMSAIIQQSFTNTEVAQAIGISPQYLGDIVKDRRTPSDEVLERLVEYLRINRNYAYYLLNRYPPEMRNNDVVLPVLDKALEWIRKPYKYVVRKVKK